MAERSIAGWNVDLYKPPSDDVKLQMHFPNLGAVQYLEPSKVWAETDGNHIHKL